MPKLKHPSRDAVTKRLRRAAGHLTATLKLLERDRSSLQPPLVRRSPPRASSSSTNNSSSASTAVTPTARCSVSSRTWHAFSEGIRAHHRGRV